MSPRQASVSSPLRGSPLAATRLAVAALRPQRFAATRQIAVEKERERKEGREERRSCIRYPLLLYCRRRFVRGSIYRFTYVEKERGGGDRDPGFWRIIGRGTCASSSPISHAEALTALQVIDPVSRVPFQVPLFTGPEVDHERWSNSAEHVVAHSCMPRALNSGVFNWHA